MREVAVLLLMSSLAGCSVVVTGDPVEVSEERRFTVGAMPQLTLRTFDGAIDVTSWDRDEVVVEITRRAASSASAEGLQVRVTQEGDRIVVDAPAPIDSPDEVRVGAVGRSVSYRVRAPRAITLTATTSDGSIQADNLDGVITLQTSEGSIRGARLDGEVRLHSGDGSITVQQGRGTFDVQSGDGSVDVEARLDGLRINTGDGAVRVTAADGSAVTADWTVATGDGAITMRLPSSLDAEIDAASDDGSIAADWVAAPDRGGREDGDALRTTLGKGGRPIRLRTGDGSISLNRQ
jgi:hypothetical protein